MTDRPSLHPFPKFVVPNPSLTNSSRTQLPQVPTYLLDAILTTSVHQHARPSRSHRRGHHGHRTKIAMAALSFLHFFELFFMILLRYDALVSPTKQVSRRTFAVTGRPLPPSLRTGAPPYTCRLSCNRPYRSIRGASLFLIRLPVKPLPPPSRRNVSAIAGEPGSRALPRRYPNCAPVALQT